MKRKSNYKSSNKIASDKKNVDPNTISSSITSNIMSEYENNLKSNKDESWITEGSVLVKLYNSFKGGKKMISFDMDDTLITPLSKKNFGKNEKDWKLFAEKKIMEDKFNEYKDKDYIFVVFSNQNGIEAGHTTEEIFWKKMDLVFAELKFPFIVFAAVKKDFYRKPCIGMFELFESKYNDNNIIDKSSSYFIGDAAGRKKDQSYPKNDFSNSDYKFALNNGLNFLTPEEFFLNIKQKIPKIDLELHTFDNNLNNHIKFDEKTQEMIILVGSPGSGKSTYCANVLVPKGYVRVNQDTLKTEKKCLDVASTEIKNGKSVIIDCTNPKKEKRSIYIKLAKDNKIKVRCFVMNVEKELAFHLNNLREINNERTHHSGAVNKIPIHTFYKYFEEPTKNEGLDEVVKVNFIPGPFVNEKDKQIFYLYS